ncbi:hypothetical protein SLUN_16855 [Streptomyces lunaelactis]|uniref:Uncharacterized protein n=1 Tax=Streptomyces lunaelactis TaxID=1535768 RepID=A0A2R4T3D7_9ACTN|nr:hypothetical protein SLUN_16855 [Streptomyces lunaelactis]
MSRRTVRMDTPKPAGYALVGQTLPQHLQQGQVPLVGAVTVGCQGLSEGSCAFPDELEELVEGRDHAGEVEDERAPRWPPGSRG